MTRIRRHKSIGPIAIDKETGNWVCVEDVPNGKKCLCICPVCDEELQSRQGEELSWHFAHLPGSSCHAEGLLKQIAIDWFLRPGSILLPSIPESIEEFLQYKTEHAQQYDQPHSQTSWESSTLGTEDGADVTLHTGKGDIDVHFILHSDDDPITSGADSILIDLTEVQESLHRFKSGKLLQDLLAQRIGRGVWLNNKELSGKISEYRRTHPPQSSTTHPKSPVPELGTPEYRQRIYLKRLAQGFMIRVPNIDRQASAAAGTVVLSHQLLTLDDVQPGFDVQGNRIDAVCTKKGRSFFLYTTCETIDETLINIQLLETLETLQKPVLLASLLKKNVGLKWLFNRGIPEAGTAYP
ncbi:MAG: hypothetical protein V7707_10815 [Motiliproteus sp.]